MCHSERSEESLQEMKSAKVFAFVVALCKSKEHRYFPAAGIKTARESTSLQAWAALNTLALTFLSTFPFGDALTAHLRCETLSVAERAEHSPHSLNQNKPRPLAAPLPLLPFRILSNPNTPSGLFKKIPPLSKGREGGVSYSMQFVLKAYY